jgi:hypothetical protein
LSDADNLLMAEILTKLDEHFGKIQVGLWAGFLSKKRGVGECIMLQTENCRVLNLK